nr:unnamed protein product [Digitaria exilis]
MTATVNSSGRAPARCICSNTTNTVPRSPTCQAVAGTNGGSAPELAHFVKHLEGAIQVASVGKRAEQKVEGGRGEGEVLVDLDEVREERRGPRPRGEEGGQEGAGVGGAAGAGQDVEQLRVCEEGWAGRGEAEEVQSGVGVEADPAQGRTEERRGEGAGGGEEAGGGGEAMEEEEAEVQSGVGVEADPAQGRTEERRGEGAGGGEEAGGGGEAMEEEEAGETAQKGGICAGIGRSGSGRVDAAAEEVERSEAATAASLLHCGCLGGGRGGAAETANGKA